MSQQKELGLADGVLPDLHLPKHPYMRFANHSMHHDPAQHSPDAHTNIVLLYRGIQDRLRK
jgi:hypothetical protein